MSGWYILPNGNIKHVNGLEIQPEHDWMPTAESADRFIAEQREAGLSEGAILKAVVAMAIECEVWVQKNLGDS